MPDREPVPDEVLEFLAHHDCGVQVGRIKATGKWLMSTDLAAEALRLRKRVGELEAGLGQIEGVLGPKGASCCEGCECEMNDALDIARTLLRCVRDPSASDTNGHGESADEVTS